MGVNLLWTGLTICFLSWLIPQATMVGSIFMLIGCIIMWLGK